MSSIKLTIADLEALPDDDNRYELIDGEVHVAKQPQWLHQRICLRIGVVLDTWSRPTGQGVVNVAPGVNFAEDSGVAPDVVWISSRRMAVVDLTSPLLPGFSRPVADLLGDD